MSATHRRHSTKPKCPASQDNFYSYAGDYGQDNEGRVPCPECGKPVKLTSQPGRERGFSKKHYIPNHNRP